MLLVVGVPRSAITDTSAQILLRIHLVMLFCPPFAVLCCECLFALGEGLTEVGGALAVCFNFFYRKIGFQRTHQITEERI